MRRPALFPQPAARRDSDRHMVRRHIVDHHSIGANDCVVANGNAAKKFGTRTDIDMTSDHGCASRPNGAQGHLLKNQAIGSHSGIRMNHDSVWVWQ
jgi:hypothetical protein